MKRTNALGAAGLFALAAITATAQQIDGGSDWMLERLPWGDPDLTGVFSSDDMRGVPVERPEEFGDRLFMTDEEFAERQERNDAEVARLDEGGTAFLSERGIRSFRQTSLIVDPPNGRMPPLTPEGEVIRAARPPRGEEPPPASWLDRSLYDRCITRGVVGSVLPVIYGNGFEIYQTPDTVVIRYEMIHEARIVHLDGRPHVDDEIRTYMGDPVGYWDGDTLVVETTNFRGETGIGLNGNGLPTTPAIKLTERFTRVDEHRIDYEVTVDDPGLYTEPFTMAMPLTNQPGYAVLPYECHEGNHAMANILSAARAEEAAAEAAQTE
ncbi:MAG TPA: hypothetical protein VMR74_13325 [Gammaproteobacteria bacterium]|nr:hypothetical protein [Gammaproteobacteria bacterium]